MKEINIGCSSNENYAQHLGVMIYSLLENCSNRERVKIFLMDGGISNNSKNKINRIVNKFGAKIFYKNPNKNLIEGLKICRHIGIETYYRFSLIEDGTYERLLYLDADLVIKGDLSEIFFKEFEDNIVFAVKDPGGSKNKKEELGIPLLEPYFNAGVLLIDCKKWKNEDITNRTLKFIKENPKKIEYADQDGLNAILIKKWAQLNPSWNVISRLYFYNYFKLKNPPNYENENIKQIVNNPKIVHYASFIKPWFFLDPSPYKSVYLYYLRKTPWKNFKFPDKNIIGIFKRVRYYVGIILKKLGCFEK